MKKLIATAGCAGLLMSFAVACSSSSTTSVARPATSPAPIVTGNETGASDSLAALRGFMTAAKQQDLQGLSTFWGDRDGPARGRYPRQEEERRELIMVRCLRHDNYAVKSVGPGPEGTVRMVVGLARTENGKPRLADMKFDMIRAGSGRWYVKQFDLEKHMGDYCQ